jgi:hypothetical protein
VADLSSLVILRIGKHSTTNAVTSSDANSITYVCAEYEGDLGLADFKPRKLERNLRRGDNERYPRVVGPDMEAKVTIKQLLRGLNGNSGGTVASTDNGELRPIFDCAFGVLGNGGTGNTAVSSGSTSTVLRVTSSAGFGAGDMVLFNDGTELIAREIVSISSNDLTLDRAYSGSPTNGGTVYCGVVWYPDNDVSAHAHLSVDAEGENWRRRAFGGMASSLTLDFPANGGLAMVSSSWDFSEWEDTAEGMSFSAPTVGSTIPCIDGTFWVGATEYLLRDLKVALSLTKAQRSTYSGTNGWAGYAVTDKVVTMEGSIPLGALTSEGTDSLVGTFQGATAQDIAVQIGRSAGAAVYMRMPAADIDAEIVSIDGMDHIKFTATGARSGNHSNVPGAFRIGLF